MIQWFKNLFSKLFSSPVAEKPPVVVDHQPYQRQDPPWLALAKKEQAAGVQEIAGSKHNERILEYHRATSLKATTDEVPWCASFMSWLFVNCGLQSRRSARAKDWLSWGLPLKKPVYGCVVIYTRMGGGHIDLYLSGYGTGRIKGLGGNESNKVTDNSQDESSVVGYRWPLDYPLP